MRYTVAWTRFAENQLANLWLNATDRKAVEQAANRADVEWKTMHSARVKTLVDPTAY